MTILLIQVWAELYEDWDPVIVELVSDLLSAAWGWSDAEWSGEMSAKSEEDELQGDIKDGFAFPFGSAGAHGGFTDTRPPRPPPSPSSSSSSRR